jgi:hypothetical protein
MMKIDGNNPAINPAADANKQSSKAETNSRWRDQSVRYHYQDRVELSDRYNDEKLETRQQASSSDNYTAEDSRSTNHNIGNQDLITYDRQVVMHNNSIQGNNVSDKLESEDAPSQGEDMNIGLSQNRLNQIRERIAGSYYDQKKIIQAVSELMTEEIKKK